MTRIYKRQRGDALPTPRTALHTRYVRVLVFCNSCRHQVDAVDADRIATTHYRANDHNAPCR